jgi:hypothetical protein
MNLGRSSGFVVRKTQESLGDLSTVHLIPVDKKVPVELLPKM